MGAKMSYMRETPQLKRQRTRRAHQSCHPSELLRAPSHHYTYPRANPEPRETVYPNSPTLLDYCLSTVSLDPEHPPGLLTIELDKESYSFASLASLHPDVPSEKNCRDTPAFESTSDGRYISALDGHLILWIPRGAVIKPRTPFSPTDVVSDASETRILYSASGDVDSSFDMIIVLEQIYIQRASTDDISTFLPSLLGTSESDPFSKIMPLDTLNDGLDGIDARFMTPTVDQGENHIRRLLLWNEDTGGVMQRLSVYLTDDAALNRTRELATVAQRIVESVAPGSNIFNLAPRRQAIDFLNVEGTERLLLEVELPDNLVWTIDENPAGGKTVTFHKVGRCEDKQSRLILNLGPFHSSKCAPCLADDTAEHCIVFGQQAQWRSLRGRGKSSIVHKCCVTVPLSSGPEREVHLYFEHVSESQDVQFKQLVQSMSWTTAPKPED